MRLIPGMTVIVPADAKEARKATLALAEFRGPAYMRLARLATPVFEEDYPFEIGKANVLREGTDAAVFACGLMVSETLAAARLLEACLLYTSYRPCSPYAAPWRPGPCPRRWNSPGPGNRWRRPRRGPSCCRGDPGECCGAGGNS